MNLMSMGNQATAADNSPAKAGVLVVDDHPVVRDGLVRILNNEPDLVCCGEAGTIADALSEALRLRPDVLILDLRLKGVDSLDLIKTLKAQLPGTRILILSQYDAPFYVERALRAGALGYVSKEN